MKTKAAVCYEAGKNLEIETVDLEGPKFGEVLVEIKASGVCHTDEFTRSGGDPEGLFPVIFGHEGAGIVVDVGPGIISLKKGDHVIPLYTPECRQCKSCLSGKTNLCTSIRATQGQGVMPDGGADYSFECVGNTKLMRQALECCHRGWGKSVIIGVAGAGQEIATRPFQLVTGRTWMGTAFGGAKGRRDVPKIVDWYMDGKIDIDSLITHTMPVEKINHAFELMHRGESIRSVVTF